jgi:hypothetical protein
MKRRALAADEPPSKTQSQPAASNQSKARTARRSSADSAEHSSSHRHAAAPDSKRPLEQKGNLNRKAPAATAPQGSGRRFAPLPVGGGGRPGHPCLWRSPKTKWRANDDHPRIACLRAARGEPPTFRLQPIGPDAGPSAGLPRPPRLYGPIEHSRPSSRERQTRRIGIELRQTILNSFYEAKGARG